MAGSVGARQTSVWPAGWVASVRVSGKMSEGLARVKPFGEFWNTEQVQPHQLRRGKTLVPTHLLDSWALLISSEISTNLSNF